MSNVFGVVNKPLFDTTVFKVGQPVHVIDYDNGVEFNAIIVEVSPLFLDILSYDKLEDKAVFSKITVEEFVDGIYELKALVEMKLEDANKSSVDKKDEINVEILDADYSNEDEGEWDPNPSNGIETLDLTESSSFSAEEGLDEDSTESE